MLEPLWLHLETYLLRVNETGGEKFLRNRKHLFVIEDTGRGLA